MEWNRSETIALASVKCVHCMGLGLRNGRGKQVPCACVLREIFRACYSRFKSCVGKAKNFTSVRLEHIGQGGSSNRGVVYGRKTEEYIADFYLMAKRSLDAADWKLFNAHYLMGADWKLCCRMMKMERGNFFHAIYRIEAKLGRIFRETEPFSLFPLDEYFGNTVRGGRVAPNTPQHAGRGPVRPPVNIPVPAEPVSPVDPDPATSTFITDMPKAA